MSIVSNSRFVTPTPWQKPAPPVMTVDELAALGAVDLADPFTTGKLRAMQRRLREQRERRYDYLFDNDDAFAAYSRQVDADLRVVDQLIQLAERTAKHSMPAPEGSPTNRARKLPKIPRRTTPDPFGSDEGGRTSLSASDFVWIDRQSRDHAQLSDEAIMELVRMEAFTDNVSDQRLLSSILDPVREAEDRRLRIRSAKVDAAKPKPVTLDGDLAGAWVGSIAAVVGERIRDAEANLTSQEAAARGRDLVLKARKVVTDEYESTVGEARTRLAAIEAAT